jgi:hypothetical protein
MSRARWGDDRVSAENLIAGDGQGKRDLLKGRCRRSPAPERRHAPRETA